MLVGFASAGPRQAGLRAANGLRGATSASIRNRYYIDGWFMQRACARHIEPCGVRSARVCMPACCATYGRSFFANMLMGLQPGQALHVLERMRI